MTRKAPVKRLGSTPKRVESRKSPVPRKITVKAAPAPPVKRKQKRTPKINWVEVARQFVNGILENPDDPASVRRWPILADVARSFKISETMIYMMAREEKWNDRREAFQRELRQLEDTRLASELADRRVRSQVQFATIGQNLAGEVQAHIVEVRRKRQTNPNALMDPKTLKAVTGSLRTAQQVVEVAFGKPADGEGSVHEDWVLFVTAPPVPVHQALPDIDAEEPEFGGVVTPPRGA